MVLLNIQAWIWMAAEPKRLSRAAATSIRKALAGDGIAITSASLWELAMLLDAGRSRGHGTTESSVARFVESTAVVSPEITPRIAALATMFPDCFPSDPDDRLIPAAARSHGLALVTRDQRIQACPLIRTIW